MLKQICKVISDYMGALVLLSAALGLLLPDVFDNIKPTVINPLLGVIMFGMGLTLKPKDFAVVFSRPTWLSSPSCPCWLGCCRAPFPSTRLSP